MIAIHYLFCRLQTKTTCSEKNALLQSVSVELTMGSKQLSLNTNFLVQSNTTHIYSIISPQHSQSLKQIKSAVFGMREVIFLQWKLHIFASMCGCICIWRLNVIKWAWLWSEIAREVDIYVFMMLFFFHRT